jgi:hypothetical protein
MTCLPDDRGATLAEAIIAIGILTGAVVAMAGLSSLAIRNAAVARERSMATILAVQKMESLCRDVAAVGVSPANAWQVDTPGFVEFLDAYGSPVANSGGSLYVRRWSIVPLPADANLVALQVEVAPRRTPHGGHARLAGIRSRAAW